MKCIDNCLWCYDHGDQEHTMRVGTRFDGQIFVYCEVCDMRGPCCETEDEATLAWQQIYDGFMIGTEGFVE